MLNRKGHQLEVLYIENLYNIDSNKCLTMQLSSRRLSVVFRKWV